MNPLWLKYWPEVLVGILVAVLCTGFSVYIEMLKTERNQAKSELATCQANYALAKEANDEMKAAVDRQNEAIVDLQKQEAQRTQAAKAAEARAEVQAKPIEQHAATIAALKLPDDECSALKILVDEARK